MKPSDYSAWFAVRILKLQRCMVVNQLGSLYRLINIGWKGELVLTHLPKLQYDSFGEERPFDRGFVHQFEP